MKFLFYLLVFLLLLLITCIPRLYSQCLTAPSVAACTGTEPLIADGNTLNTGITKWYYGASTTFNSLTLNGGTLIVCGNLTIDKFFMDSGKIFIQPGGRFVIGNGIGYGLALKGNSYLYNYGTLEVRRNLSLENGWTSPTKPNVLINATRTAVFKMSNQYFVINNAHSWFVNKGKADFHGLITDPQAMPGSVCLGRGSETIMTVLYNKVKFSYIAPEPYACLSVSEFSQIWDTLTNNPYINVCLGATHKTDSSCRPWGCKPSWGLANLFRGCGACNSIQVLSNNFISFSGEQNPNGNMLYWEMEKAAAVSDFTIEYSTDGEEFKSIPSQYNYKKVNGKQYTYVDIAPAPGINYYRVRYTDSISKLIIYSLVIQIKSSHISALLVYPNPFRDQLFLSLPGKYSSAGIYISNIYGQEIARQQLLPATARQQVYLPAWLLPGTYIITVAAGSQTWKQKIVKQ
jgi:hypothetical protein